MGIIADKIRALTPPADISRIMGQVEDLLDRSIAAEGYVIRETLPPFEDAHRIDLSSIDFEKLAEKFAAGRKRTINEKLLDQGLPRVYTPELFEQKTSAVFQHVYDAYYGARRSLYAAA